MAYSVPKSNNKARAKTSKNRARHRVCHTWPDPRSLTQWSVIRRPCSNTGTASEHHVQGCRSGF